MVVGVVHRGATWTTGRGTVGAGSPVPPKANTIFEIGSVTKTFTATVLADLVEEGLVALDDPVQGYLPDNLALPVRGRAITLGDLATHTAGLPRLPKGMLRRALRERENPYATFDGDDLERALRKTRPRHPPGEKIRYSNFGYGLLGQALAARTGRSFEALVQERIGRPLALADTGITVPPSSSARFADRHNRRGRPVPHWDIPTLAGAGALRSTVADLLRYVALQLDPPASRLGRAAALTHEPRARRGGVAQCLGWLLLRERGNRAPVHWHNGGTGGFRSFVGFSIPAATGVVVLAGTARSVDRIGFELLRELTGS